MTLPGPLLLVTDRLSSRRPLIDVVGACVAAGANWIWLRDRDLAPAERLTLARGLQRSCGAGLVLTIGADVDLALAVDAAGVHLPADADVGAARARLGAGKLVGVSAHALDDIRRARDDGADYATFSPIFPSASKPGYGPALGLDALRRAASLGLPLVALGGVDAPRARACRAAGAAGVAVMGGVLAAADPRAVVQDLRRASADDRRRQP